MQPGRLLGQQNKTAAEDLSRLKSTHHGRQPIVTQRSDKGPYLIAISPNPARTVTIDAWGKYY